MHLFRDPTEGIDEQITGLHEGILSRRSNRPKPAATTPQVANRRHRPSLPPLVSPA